MTYGYMKVEYNEIYRWSKNEYLSSEEKITQQGTYLFFLYYQGSQNEVTLSHLEYLLLGLSP